MLLGHALTSGSSRFEMATLLSALSRAWFYVSYTILTTEVVGFPLIWPSFGVGCH